MALRTMLVAMIVVIFTTLEPDKSAIATAAPYMGLDTMHILPGDASEGLYGLGPMITVDDSIVYGTNSLGGTVSYYYGTLFKVINSGSWWSASSTFSIVHEFGDGSVANDGYACSGKLAKDNSGYIYGVCGGGGAYGYGTVYKLNTSNNVLTILYSFGGVSNDGLSPDAGLVRDGSGNIYGTTYFGDGTAEYGTIWKLTPSGGGYSYSILHNFAGGTDGEGASALILGTDGNLYGTTLAGGGAPAYGIYWRYNLSTDTFTKIGNAAAGLGFYGDLTQVPTSYTSGGRLEFWGTTINGGSGCNGIGCGTVYRLSETYAGSGSFNYTTMYTFSNGTNEGYQPSRNLVFSPNFAAFGALYGALSDGGVSGSGSFFRIDLSGNYSEIPSNAGQWTGAYPADAPTGLVEGKIGSSSPVFFGNSMLGGNGEGWLWYIYLF